jgi:DNA-binding MarR family transcriptional regulator/N-acetylglutamate synthase-like GNAT family acetyltransferase
MKNNDNLSKSVETVRRFNRFYTKQIGILTERLAESPFSLIEARIIYELASRGSSTATELRNELALDPGYLSRILKRLQKNNLVEKKDAVGDGRKQILSLTPKGSREFEELDRKTHDQVATMLKTLSSSNRHRTLECMKTIESVLDSNRVPSDRSYILRDPRPGDYGWIVESNGRLYAEEYGWDTSYEALVAEIVADFVRNFDPKKERCWIAERDGENVGSVFVVKKSVTVAKLRMLLVEPKARGLGIGKRLVDECTRFARQAGYKKITLWTQSMLTAARGIYKNGGYELVASEPNRLFGHDLVSETWELRL